MAAKLSFVTAALKPHYFGFVRGNDSVDEAGVAELRRILSGGDAERMTMEFESAFAAQIGTGECVSFAAGRMAFYALMQALGIGAGDEVILTGFTCSVMANAVWRTGATPVYADIASDTFGTDPSDVARKLTPRTRMIVAQHSFGIPCEIDELATLARSRGIFLLEDCALTLGSKFHGRTAGDWGDAAIFSTDHSKPLNTITGGLLYTRDAALAARVRDAQRALPTLDPEHQARLFGRFLLERKYYRPSRYGLGRLLTKLAGGRRKLMEKFGRPKEFVLLEADFKPRVKAGAYPYPARLPAFLAQLGLHELSRWPDEARRRAALLARFLAIADETGLRPHLPAAYSDSAREIVPLRFVYAHPRAAEIARRMAPHLEVDWFWFQEPVSFAPLGGESFKYGAGSCPNAERIGREVVNWPCAIPVGDEERLLALFREAHAGLA